MIVLVCLVVRSPLAAFTLPSIKIKANIVNNEQVRCYQNSPDCNCTLAVASDDWEDIIFCVPNYLHNILYSKISGFHPKAPRRTKATTQKPLIPMQRANKSISTGLLPFALCLARQTTKAWRALCVVFLFAVYVLAANQERSFTSCSLRLVLLL